MNCRKVRSYLSASYDGTSNAELTRELETHIRSCKSCEREQRYIEEIVSAAKTLPQTHIPEDFNLQLMNRIFAEQHRPTESYLPQPAPSVWRRSLAWTSGLAVVGVSAVLAIVFLSSAPTHTNQDEASLASSPTVVDQQFVRSPRQQEPISVYENIIGVSGERSQYRATTMQNVRSLQVDRGKIDSLYRAYMQHLNSQRRAQTQFVRAAGYQRIDNDVNYGVIPPRRIPSTSPLLQNASSR